MLCPELSSSLPHKRQHKSVDAAIPIRKGVKACHQPIVSQYGNQPLGAWRLHCRLGGSTAWHKGRPKQRSGKSLPRHQQDQPSLVNNQQLEPYGSDDLRGMMMAVIDLKLKYDGVRYLMAVLMTAVMMAVMASG